MTGGTVKTAATGTGTAAGVSVIPNYTLSVRPSSISATTS
jgi:hypothetical protein